MIAVALLYLQWLPAVRAVEEARGDPSTAAAFHAEVLRLPRARARSRASGWRCRSRATTGRRPTSRRSYPLARGWHRQLDRKVNPLFYDREQPLTPRATSAGCARTPCAGSRSRRRRWTSPRSAERELLLAGQPFLEPRARSADWRIWEVRDPEPPVSGAARLTAAGADGFDLEATRPGPGARAPARDAVLDRRRRRRLRVGGRRVGLDAGPGPPRRHAARARTVLRPRRRCGASRAARSRPATPVPRECGQPPCSRALNRG